MDPDEQRNRIADVIASQQGQMAQPGLDAAQAATAQQGATSQPPPPPPNAGGWGRGAMMRGMFGGGGGPMANRARPVVDGKFQDGSNGERIPAPGEQYTGYGTNGELQAKQAALQQRMAQGMPRPMPGGGMPMGSKGSAADMGGGGMPAPQPTGSSMGSKGSPAMGMGGA